MAQKKRSKRKIAAQVAAATCAALILSLLVANIFIPVKYLFAYFGYGSDRVDGVMRVRFVDVGYGDCTVVEFPDGKTLLVDAGDGSHSATDSVLKALNRSGIGKIDYLVCTSVKREHCGGLAEVIKYKRVKRAFVPYCKATDITDGYRNFCKAVKDADIQTEICEYGNGVFCDEYDYGFCFLSPSVHTLESEFSEYYLLNTQPNSENIDNASAVMWVYCKDTGFLLLGDNRRTSLERLCLSYETENCFIMGDRRITLSDCRVVKIAAHGNKDSAYAPLFDLVRPEYAVLSTHRDVPPSMQAVSDAQRYSALYRTDFDGDITFVNDGNKFTVKKEKK